MEGCEHVLTPVGHAAFGITGIVACVDCASIDWWGPSGLVAATEALTRMFGDLELVATLPLVGGPGPSVYAYRPTTAGERRHLGVFPPGSWLRAHPGLWLSTDGSLLLLSPTDPAVARHLDRGA